MDEAILWKQYQKHKSEEARQELIINHLPLVKQIVGRIMIKLPNHLDKEDLVSFGIMGLLDAIDKFDLQQGVKFSSYAYVRVKGAIYDEIRKCSLLPRTVMQQIKEYTKAQAELESELGEVNQKIIADKMGIPEAELDRTLQYVNMFSVTSLDEFLDIGNGETVTRADWIEDEKATDPVKSLEKIESEIILAKAIENLQDRDKLILSLYYYEELTLMEIAQVIEVSESRVCQLHARALTRLRQELNKLNY